jgi:hypothetical protein
MKLRLPSAILFAAFATLAIAQQAAAPANRTPPKPQATQAAGAAADKVWVNTKTNVYHCPGERYYGKTKEGRYMTESEAKKSGAKGERGETCFK